jgi:hypothetical protein
VTVEVFKVIELVLLGGIQRREASADLKTMCEEGLMRWSPELECLKSG